MPPTPSPGSIVASARLDAAAREGGAVRDRPTAKAISGSLEQLSIADLLQTAEAARRSGRIEVRSDGRRALLWLIEGRVVDAEIAGGPRGADAVYEAALWEDGEFLADFTPVDVEVRIATSTSGLLLEAMRRRDEAERPSPPHASIPDPPPPPPRALFAMHRSLTLLNVAAAYAAEHAEPSLVAARLETARERVAELRPDQAADLARFRVEPSGSIVALGAPADADAIVTATALWLEALFVDLERAFPGRFPLARLRAVTEAIQGDLLELGFDRALGFNASGDRP